MTKTCSDEILMSDGGRVDWSEAWLENLTSKHNVRVDLKSRLKNKTTDKKMLSESSRRQQHS